MKAREIIDWLIANHGEMWVDPDGMFVIRARGFAVSAVLPKWTHHHADLALFERMIDDAFDTIVRMVQES